ncbi:MAG TPA: HAMP domain-containing sensor histidine kinase [Brevundimonas sp.]|nr:HAMP domain-containing sensor histidine kinase [Brevundimonas sp.]
MRREPGLSVRLKLTLSYVAFLMLAGVLLLAAVWVFLLRHVTLDVLVPNLADFPRVFDPSNFGALVFGPAAVLVLAFLLVFGLVGGWILAGRMLAPLVRISAATQVAANGSLSHRISLEGRQDEFRDLADSFDVMLARLEAQVAEQRRFAANASHELRTPLTISQTLLEVARNDPNHDSSELIEQLHAVNARAINLTEALLVLSRADQRAFTQEAVDLSLLVEETVETLLPFAETCGVAIHVGGDITPAQGSQPLLLQLTTNLVHNAIVHNLPTQGAVWISTSVVDEGVGLSVENTGEELSPKMVSTLAEPFQRGAERIRSGHAGVGLGLAIVKSIVQAHDGVLTLAPRPGGGLRVTVQLPGAPVAPIGPSPLTASRVGTSTGRPT